MPLWAAVLGAAAFAAHRIYVTAESVTAARRRGNPNATLASPYLRAEDADDDAFFRAMQRRRMGKV